MVGGEDVYISKMIVAISGNYTDNAQTIIQNSVDRWILMTMNEYMELPGCMTCGATLDSAVSNTEDAKKEWLLAALEEGQEIFRSDDLNDYSGQFKLRIPKSLHRQLSEQSKREGISMNQSVNLFWKRFCEMVCLEQIKGTSSKFSLRMVSLFAKGLNFLITTPQISFAGFGGD